MEKLPPLHSYVVFCHHIPLHIVLGGIHLGLLSKDESFQHLDALIHRGDDSFHPLFAGEFFRLPRKARKKLFKRICLKQLPG